MRNLTFTPDAFEQFTAWRDEDPETQDRLIRLLLDVRRDPFKGIGKPEPLKGDLQGFWSRRITGEHRLVYKVTEESILVQSCKYHYRK